VPLFGGPKKQAKQLLRVAEPASVAEAQRLLDDGAVLFTEDLGAPSRLGVALLELLFSHPLSGAEANHDVALYVATLGYCVRDAQSTLGAPELSRESLHAELVQVDDRGNVDYDAMAEDERLFKLFDQLLGAALEEDTLPAAPPTWNAMVALTTVEVQKRVAGDVARAFTLERVGFALGFGYVVRGLEEVVGELPLSRHDIDQRG
jgi:hypothetical protein